jgi:2-polyprenyl-3-methyl-5-hydroxy-6-metoxy-1,4-benzoquinol methylase
VSLHVAANTGAQIIGVEPDERRAALARERGLDVRAEMLTDDLLARLGSFDVVMFADVLEHLPDPLALLRIATSALAPGGAIVVSVPNVAHWSVRLDLMRGRFQYRETGIMDATHLRWFTRDGIALLLNAAGLRIESARVTLGVDLQCYWERWPWRRMSRDRRAAWVRRGVRRWPELFGCQWIVRAVAAPE